MELTIEHAREIEEHIPALRRFARGLTGTVDAADDLVQDCLVKAITNIHRFQEGTNLRAWLFTIAHNAYLDAIRSRHRRGPHVDIDDHSGQLSAPANQMAHIELEEFRRAFSRLCESDREVILLVGMEGFSYEEVASMLDIPVGTVKSRLSRSRRRLRELQARGAPLRRQASKTAGRVTESRRSGAGV